MYSLLYNIFFALKRRDKSKNNKVISSLCKKYYNFFDAYLNIITRKFFEKFPSKKNRLNKKARDKKIIVSLTSFPARIDKVWITVETLLRQSIKPDEIILWLADTQFDGFDSLPKKLKDLTKCGLTIKFCDDLRSHKKYYYTFQQYPNDLVILADDDIFYPKDTIKQLLKMHKKYPNDIISITSQSVPENITELPSVWESLKEQVISSRKTQPFTGQGAMFQPKQYKDVLYNKELIERLIPFADDLWIYLIGYLSGVNVTTIHKYRCFNNTIWGTGESSLFAKNGKNGGNMNDVQWKNLVEYFKEELNI